MNANRLRLLLDAFINQPKSENSPHTFPEDLQYLEDRGFICPNYNAITLTGENKIRAIIELMS